MDADKVKFVIEYFALDIYCSLFKAKTAASRDGKEKKTSDTRKPVVGSSRYTFTKIYVFDRDPMRENQMRVSEKKTGARTKKTKGAMREENRRRRRTTRTLSSACGAMRTARRGDA